MVLEGNVSPNPVQEQCPQVSIIYLNGGQISSRDTHQQEFAHGSGFIYRDLYNHKVSKEGSKYIYQFPNIKIKLSRVNYMNHQLRVMDDRSGQEIRINVNGNTVAKGINLTGRVYTFTLASSQPPRRIAKPHKTRKKKGAMNILWIIDAYGWAYDEGFKGFLSEMTKQHPEWIVEKCLAKHVMNREVNPGNYDVVFCWAWWDFYGNKMNVWTSLLDKLNSVSTVLCIAGEDIIKHMSSARKTFRDFPYLGANNSRLTTQLRELFPYRSVFNLPYGVNLHKFHPDRMPKQFKVGWVGHQKRGLKRFGLAEEACRLAGVPLHVAGHVTTDAYIPSQLMPAWYRDKSVLLITSQSEVHPLVYYEMLATGRPVLATRVGDINETAKEGVNGYYFPVNVTARQIANKLVKLKKDRKTLLRMGRNARHNVVAKWSWEKVLPMYMYAIDEVLGKFTVSMLVSRDDTKMQKAVASVVRQQPDEFRAYIDTVKLPDQTKARKILEKAGAKIFEQRVTKCKEHHQDVVRAVHVAILEAQYRRVQWIDDDDELLDAADLVPLVGDGIGIVYGNVEQRFPGGRVVKRHGNPIKNPLQMANMKGSGVIYNRDLFKRVHKYVDHGYFWDYKIGYWLLRHGYKLRYFNRFMSIQNVNMNHSPHRKSLYDKWPRMIENMDKLKLKETKNEN